MLTDSDLVIFKAAPPRSFAGLMSLYESNYIRLKWLISDFSRLGRDSMSSVPGDCDLYLSVQERTRYTTTVRLTYYFPAGHAGELAADPDLKLRVYHDAKMAEVLECCATTRHAALHEFLNEQGSELERRWRRNVFLNKWLEYCSERGHAFGDLEQPLDAP